MMLCFVEANLKVIITFWLLFRSNPGYLEPGEGKQFEFNELVTKLPTDRLCPECKVIKTRRSYHCTVCKRCVDRYEGHCVWLNNCIGRLNANMYISFVFYLWLGLLVIIILSATNIGVTYCDVEKYGTPCVYKFLCIGCNNLTVHYIVTVGDSIICFIYILPITWHTIMQFMNYGRG